MEKNKLDSPYQAKYDLIYSLSMTTNTIKEGLRKTFLQHGYDITIDNFAVLSRLWQYGALTQQQLCTLTCKNKSNLTRILDSMEKKNMIERTLCPSDRRSFSISLTPYSVSLKQVLPPIATQYGNELFGQISASELETLNDILAKLGKQEIFFT